MLEDKRTKSEAARRNAADKFALAAQREDEFRREKEKRLQVDAAKTARLRALRLAKEEADSKARAEEAARLVKPAVPRAKKVRAAVS
jgi:hypothetical protein